MTTITTINSGDLISASRTDINTNFANLNSDKIETSVLDTDTTLAANSDAKVATQKAVKAYVDAGGNVNASETARGIVEEATDAEVAAGTATGATGAKLFVTPTKLLASKVSPVKAMVAGETINGATLPVPVYQNTSDNQYYACDGNDTAKLKFQGFAISNAVDNGAINIQFSGVVSGFTGLTEGTPYYVQDSVGTIGATPGTIRVLVGIAISETELLIRKGTLMAAGTSTTGTATGSLAVTSGFRPSKIRVLAQRATNTSIMDMTWVNGAIVASSIIFDESAAQAQTASTPIFYSNADGTEYMTFSITSVTETGFTISWTETGNTNDGNFMYVAEGEI